MSKFLVELMELINKHSLENRSNTPDYILADYLGDCLAGYERAVQRRGAMQAVSAKYDDARGSKSTGEVRANDDLTQASPSGPEAAQERK